MTDWKRLNETVRITSDWLTLVGERWRCDKGRELDYWRVEKVDSVIVLPMQSGHAYCVTPAYRPGVGRETLDFPGGRLSPDCAPMEMVSPLLERELGVSPEAIRRVDPINHMKWNVNSSFSNQGLWGFVAEIDANFAIQDSFVGARVKADSGGLAALLERLDCLQCRAVLLEWQRVALK